MLSHPAVPSHKLLEVSPSCHTVTMLCLGTGDARLHELVGKCGSDPLPEGRDLQSRCWSHQLSLP